VNGQPVEGLEAEHVAPLLRGRAETNASVSIQRSEDQLQVSVYCAYQGQEPEQILLVETSDKSFELPRSRIRKHETAEQAADRVLEQLGVHSQSEEKLQRTVFRAWTDTLSAGNKEYPELEVTRHNQSVMVLGGCGCLGGDVPPGTPFPVSDTRNAMWVSESDRKTWAPGPHSPLALRCFLKDHMLGFQQVESKWTDEQTKRLCDELNQAQCQLEMVEMEDGRLNLVREMLIVDVRLRRELEGQRVVLRLKSKNDTPWRWEQYVVSSMSVGTNPAALAQLTLFHKVLTVDGDQPDFPLTKGEVFRAEPAPTRGEWFPGLLSRYVHFLFHGDGSSLPPHTFDKRDLRTQTKYEWAWEAAGAPTPKSESQGGYLSDAQPAHDKDRASPFLLLVHQGQPGAVEMMLVPSEGEARELLAATDEGLSATILHKTGKDLAVVAQRGSDDWMFHEMLGKAYSQILRA